MRDITFIFKIFIIMDRVIFVSIGRGMRFDENSTQSQSTIINIIYAFYMCADIITQTCKRVHKEGGG
jgi:hypothetical protein